ncbi:MAG TPA: hypothetical protein VNR87_16210 [Flavisolibacter sp.]|nr:hypothetical protein [Flavisolibacter sp.]
MDNLNEIEARLWAYIDGFSEEKEAAEIRRLIEENAAWRARYHELLDVHSLIGASELEQPSLRFTMNVMDQIAKHQIAPAAKAYINKKIIWSIGLFFISTILGFLIYGFSQTDWSQASDSKATFGIDLNKVDYSQMFNNNFVNIFMMLNVVLGLMLLDRYLSNRKKQLLKQAH